MATFKLILNRLSLQQAMFFLRLVRKKISVITWIRVFVSWHFSVELSQTIWKIHTKSYY